MDVVELYRPWLDSNNLVHWERRNGTGNSGNGMDYSGPMAYALIHYHDSEIPNTKALIDLKVAVLRCGREDTNTIVDTLPWPGVYKRTPEGYYGHQSHEDYWGIALISQLTDYRIAGAILRYWRTHNFNGNSVDPTKWRWSSWFGRMPHLIAHYQFVWNETPNLYRQFIWSLALLITIIKPRKSADSHRRAWTMTKVAENSPGSNKFIKAVISVWRFAFKRKFPHGLGEVYYNWGWPRDHATVEIFWDKF